MEIILIAAMAANRVIGRDNRMPWHLPEELKRFRETTWGHTVIMGRRTHESIGRPLPGRRNIVVTRDKGYRSEGCLIAHSLGEAYAFCDDAALIFIIGGEQLYRLGINDADTLILTVLEMPYQGDTFFPEFSEASFKKIRCEDMPGAPVPYSVRTYKRIRSRSDKTSSRLDS